uniref:Uncharacterized protein n=1 Tax=Bionectria ochroleuca TaxID=29856 RepID=A0A0B7KFC9_BIOOC
MDYWVAPWEDAMILFQAVTCQITPKVPWQRALWSRVPLLDPLLFLTAKGWQGFMRQHTIGQKAQSLSSSALHNDRSPPYLRRTPRRDSSSNHFARGVALYNVVNTIDPAI